MNQSTVNPIVSALAYVREGLLAEMVCDEHWVGELSASALSTATAISALSFAIEADVDHFDNDLARSQIDAGLNWLSSRQNEDGGFGDTDKNYSNISTTMLVAAALTAAGKTDHNGTTFERAMAYVERCGGVEGIRKRYGDDKTFAVPILANAAMAGLVDWREVGVLPFEAACVPQKFYHLMNLPVVSYAIPALVAIGQVKFHFDPPRNPVTRWIRHFSIERSLNVLQKMQPSSGGYLEAVPLTSFVCMALIRSGRGGHAVVRNGIQFLLNSFRQSDPTTGTWPIDTNLATWVTTLSVNALASDSAFEFEDDCWRSCLNWILDCQYDEVHAFTGSPPGGWGWSDLSGSVPDADDTPGALLALRVFWNQERFEKDKTRLLKSAHRGVNWLLGLQNRDGGWPTFCRGWGKLPFDRSGSDLTAHVVRALVRWQDSVKESRIERAVIRGFMYLEKNQQKDGSWLPLWFGNQDQADDINPFYGTAKVLQAYYESGRIDTKSAQNGLEWVRESQNSDGGWGGGRSVKFSTLRSTSSVEETALCTEALLLDKAESSRAAAVAGLDWLRLAVDRDAVDQCTPIGFYFAKLWYFEKLYPLIFATSALGKAKSVCGNESVGRMN